MFGQFDDVIRAHARMIGARGGQSRSARKIKAARRNIEKALKKRWGKDYQIASRIERLR